MDEDISQAKRHERSDYTVWRVKFVGSLPN